MHLKKEFIGVVFTKLRPGVGQIFFDSNTVKPEHYLNYRNLGFEEIFDECGENCGCEKQSEDFPSKLDEAKKDTETYINKDNKKGPGRPNSTRQLLENID